MDINQLDQRERKKKKFKKKVLANATDLRCEMLMFSRGGKWELSGAAFQQGFVCTGHGLKWQLILSKAVREGMAELMRKWKNYVAEFVILPLYPFPKRTCGSCLFQLVSELLGRLKYEKWGQYNPKMQCCEFNDLAVHG